MRLKSKEDFGVVSRRSIQKELSQTKTLHKAPKATRIDYLSAGCEYVDYSYLFAGKAVKLVESTSIFNTSGWYEFVYDEDRQAVNKKLGYSDKKRLYLLYKPVLK